MPQSAVGRTDGAVDASGVLVARAPAGGVVALARARAVLGTQLLGLAQRPILEVRGSARGAIQALGKPGEGPSEAMRLTPQVIPKNLCNASGWRMHLRTQTENVRNPCVGGRDGPQAVRRG